MRISYMQAVGAGEHLPLYSVLSGSHATSGLLGRGISIRFPGHDVHYNTFYETTTGTGTAKQP